MTMTIWIGLEIAFFKRNIIDHSMYILSGFKIYFRTFKEGEILPNLNAHLRPVLRTRCALDSSRTNNQNFLTMGKLFHSSKSKASTFEISKLSTIFETDLVITNNLSNRPFKCNMMALR